LHQPCGLCFLLGSSLELKVAAQIKNTRHSSGSGLRQRLSMAYTLMSALMTHQALVRVLLANYQTITG
jgi:hypothetical protein